MDRKRKWDQPGAPEDDESPSKVARTDDKSAADAAAAAAAIAAKIAAQFAGGGAGGATTGSSAIVGFGSLGDRKDPHDGDYTQDIEINDVRNRYMLTKGATQQQIHQETGASVTTKGIWYPDKSKATERDPPLYLHISAATPDVLAKAVAKVEELINTDMGPLTEERRRPERERRKWPDEKLFVNLEPLRNFNVRAKVVGPTGMFVKHIQSETGTRVQIKGLGSGFFDSETGKESEEPMHIHITGPDEQQLERAKILTEDLLEVVRAEHAKARQALYQQQMELHQAQMAQYGGYAGYQGYAPQPSGDAPPPPPPDAPPPPPPEDGAAPPPPDGAPPGAGGPSPQTSYDAFAQYWAAYGYDVQSEEFKTWMASQQASYAQAYAAPNASQSTEPPPPPPSEAPPPPPPA